MEDPHFLCAFLHRRYHVESISYTALLTDSAPAFNRGDDGIAGNDDKDDDEAIDDDYYCFICLSALPYATCCILMFRPCDFPLPDCRVAGHLNWSKVKP